MSRKFNNMLNPVSPCETIVAASHTHHYVPQWLQRRFLRGECRYFYRDLKPERVTKPDGTYYTRRNTLHWGPEKCFAAEDLYSVNLPGRQSDIVEREFFGAIDDQAAKAIDFFVTGDFAPNNDYYTWFLRYLSVQKMRTPKGLAWLRSFGSYAFGPLLTPEALMGTLREIGELHITTWSESVWEVVEAPSPAVGFLLTDHPVTAYNLNAYPGSRFTSYPLEPVIELLGTRTLFPLDAKHCLILSNQEFVEDPRPNASLRPRTNPRSFSFTFFSPIHIARGRILIQEQVWSINFILKKRALRYIAAPVKAWLDPEQQMPSQDWAKFDPFLRPERPTLIQEIWAEYSDGTKVAIDRLGRPITDPKRLADMAEFERQTRKSK